jgi:hypothetical protein
MSFILGVMVSALAAAVTADGTDYDHRRRIMTPSILSSHLIGPDHPHNHLYDEPLFANTNDTVQAAGVKSIAIIGEIFFSFLT